MKINPNLRNDQAQRTPPANWSQSIEVEFLNGQESDLELFSQLARQWSDASTEISLLVGSPEGKASFLVSYGTSKFIATQRCRQVVTWLGAHQGISRVAATALGSDRVSPGHRAAA